MLDQQALEKNPRATDLASWNLSRTSEPHEGFRMKVHQARSGAKIEC